MTDFPWTCECGHQTMVDLERLERRALTPVLASHGYVCKNCDCWVAVFNTDAALEDALQKMKRYPPDHPKYEFIFGKTLRKVISVQRRVESHGAR